MWEFQSHRHPQTHHRPLPGAATDIDLPPMPIQDRADERKPQATAGDAACSLSAIQLFPDVGQFFVGDARASISDFDDDGLPVFQRADFHAVAGFSELEGVVEEVMDGARGLGEW